MKLKILLLLAIGCFVFVGCSTVRGHRGYGTQPRQTSSAIVIEDGINQAEANAIAQGYFERFSPVICGGAARVTDGGAAWLSETYFGIAAVPTHELIRVDKKTGAVAWSLGPTIEDPRVIWQ